MNGLRLVASFAAMSLSSYAWADAPEARLGGAVKRAAGKAPASSTLPAGAPRRIDSGAVRYGRALGALQPDAQAATRGANETRVYQKASPAVVLIVGKSGFGSGALITADGQIITNLHVVDDAAEVGVVFKPAVEGATFGRADVRRAKVLRRDEVADLALIQVESVPAGVTPLSLGNSTTVQVGADVHAIGHPTGEAWTYTRGIVSQVRRAYAWTADDKIPHEATVIQTQTPINPGNSGGPLLDDDLSIVGINSFIGEGEGLNFAVSAEDVKSFLARTEDRISRPAAKAAADSCKREVLEEGPSKKPPGMEYLVDEDCDGKADFLLVVPTSKREPVVTIVDDDGDGVYDTVYYDDDRDGLPETALYDTDGNGKPDMRGDYRKGAEEPYRWEKIKE